jgi:hypothetical protein
VADHVYGDLPPVAVNWREYAVPTVPAGRVKGDTVGGESLMVRTIPRVLVRAGKVLSLT